MSSQHVRKGETGHFIEMTVATMGVRVEVSEAGCVEIRREPGRTEHSQFVRGSSKKN